MGKDELVWWNILQLHKDHKKWTNMSNFSFDFRVSHNWLLLARFSNAYRILTGSQLIFSAFLTQLGVTRDGSGQEILETRQDETGKKSWNCFETRQVKTLKLETCIQDKSRQNGCASRWDKTLEFSKIYIRDKSRLTKILRFQDKTGRDKSLVLSWREISQDSED